jgi:hypothetical protein
MQRPAKNPPAKKNQKPKENPRRTPKPLHRFMRDVAEHLA